MSLQQTICNLKLDDHGSQKEGKAPFTCVEPYTNLGIQGAEEVLGRGSQAGLQDSNRIRKAVSADVVNSLEERKKKKKREKHIYVPLYKREGL